MIPRESWWMDLVTAEEKVSEVGRNERMFPDTDGEEKGEDRDEG